MNANLKRSCVHLGDDDRKAIQRIRQRLQLSSDALAIRQALRLLARRLDTDQPAPITPARDGRNG